MLTPLAVDGYRAVGIRASLLIDPVGEVGACAGKTDHLPRRHVAVAAVDRVGEIPFTRIPQQQCEEGRAHHGVGRQHALFGLREQRIAPARIELRERLAVCGGGRAVEQGDAGAVQLARCLAQLVAQRRWRFRMKRSLHVPVRAVAVRQLHLPVEEHRHAGLHAAWTVAVLRDQPVHRGVDEGPLGGGEIGRLIALPRRRAGAGRGHLGGQSGTRCAAQEIAPLQRGHSGFLLIVAGVLQNGRVFFHQIFLPWKSLNGGSVGACDQTRN